MKKIIFSLICFLAVNNLFSQSYNWITPNKVYLKLYVNDDGIYRINKSDFTNAGVSTTSIDPRTVKVFYKGAETPIYFQGEDDGIFNDSDFIDFYGKRNYGGPTPHRDGFTNVIIYTVNEYYDLFSDTSVYWIGWDGSNGLRMQKSTYVSPITFTDNNFYKRVHFEKNNFYDLGETRNSNTDYRYFSTEIVVGEGWFWKQLDKDNRILTENLFIDDLSPSALICSLKIFIKPISYTESILNEHIVEVKINNTVIDTLIADDLRMIDTTITFDASSLTNNSNNSVTFRYIPVELPSYSPKVNVDFFIMSYPRDFTIRNNNLFLNFAGTDSTSKKINTSGYNSGNQTNIYDINNNIRIENYTSIQNTLTFTGKSNSSFEIINSNITKKPFRIVNRQVKDLVSTNNGADYLVIYNKLFESQAEQLRNHRQNFNSYRAAKADIEDIYDIFNYGQENPVAVRNFVKYIYDNWQSPKVKYVSLFGRASLDPKRYDPSNQYYQNFIPTYGNPPTDGYFVNFNIGTFTYYHQISIGRLPVYTTTEAQNVVDKITTYDTEQPDRWWKKYIAITGGGFRAEQISFQNKSENLINNYIGVPAPCLQVSRIYRNDSTGYITYNYKDSIKREFDRGALMVNFIGHAAAQDWEIGLDNPNTLNNGNKQPLVLSFTCFTGRCAEPNSRSFGENFFLIPNKCAIGFVGTTGWSFSGSGDNFNEKMIKNFSIDSVRIIGDLLSYASQVLGADSNSFPARNTVNSYNLIGDPATKLLMPGSPEFDIKQNDYSLSNPFPALGEPITLSIFPKNLGTYVDSVGVKFQIRKNGVATQRTDTIIRNLCFSDTLKHFFSIDTIGNYTMTVVLDPDNTYSQRFTNNDSITFALTLRNLSYVTIKPLNNSLLNSTSFKFTGLNPNVDYRKSIVKVILQVDTIKSFDSPALQTFNNSNLSGITTSFNVNLPVQTINTLYYLRTNAIVNSDSSGWSEIQKAIYNPNVSDNGKIVDSAYTIYTVKPEQYNEPDIINVVYNGNGFVLDKYNGSIMIRSYGSNGPEASYIIVDNGINNITYYSDGAGNQGMNIGKVKRLTGEVVQIKNFRMNSSTSSDSVLNFLNTFDSSQYILTYIASYVADTDSLRQTAKNKFREFGSIFADSIIHRDFRDLFDTWVFFGFLGADTTQTCEKFHRFISNNTQQPLNCDVNPVFQKASGTISQTIGPADKWKNFSWEQVLTPNSSILFDVFGIDRDNNVPTILYSNLSNNSLVNLDTVDYYAYPNLRLEAKLAIDTVLGLESPVLISTNSKYIPPAELIPDNYSFTGSDTTVQEGDSISFSVNYYNVGFIDAPRYFNKWYVKKQGIELVLQQDTIDSPLEVDSMRNSKVKFSTSGLRDPKIPSDSMDLYFEVSLVGNKNEIFSYNNTAITRFILQGDTMNPVIDITYDGIKILNGDYIQSKPTIVLKFLDDSRMVINDTSNVRVFISNNNSSFSYVPYYINGVRNPEIEILFPDNLFLQATVIYKPTLTSGEHKFRYVATDVTGNFADTIINSVIVDFNLSITEMANYPNPMKNETNFMFKLSGELNPTSCKVKIYTVAGRLIKEINTPANVGYNNINWDGKDNDGDYIANGTYLYKFIIQGNSQVETSIQKLAVLR